MYHDLNVDDGGRVPERPERRLDRPASRHLRPDNWLVVSQSRCVTATHLRAPAGAPRLARLTSLHTRVYLAFLPRRRSPNNDAREKQRAAAKRSSVPSAGKPSAAGFAQPKKQLADDGIVQLYSNCIKLASENKISQKNTWALELIDHISDIIKLEKDKDDGTNFTKASCTLDAGVKIYSTRVDSVHNEAFRMLGGLSRAAIESQQQEGADDEGDSGDEDGEGGAKKRRAKKQNTDMSATLEASFEALNAKADEVYTAVDPLFKQMSVYDSTQIVYECACMRYLGEAEPALKVLEAAIARQPDDVLLWTAKSECCVELERHGLAFEAAAVACDLDPRYRPPLLLKARLHAIRCEFQDALVSLNRVVSDRPMPSSLVCTWVWLRRLRGRPFHECVHGHDFDALLIDIDMHVHFRQIPPMASNPPPIHHCNCQ